MCVYMSSIFCCVLSTVKYYYTRSTHMDVAGPAVGTITTPAVGRAVDMEVGYFYVFYDADFYRLAYPVIPHTRISIGRA